jgi:hypothetical protein
MSDIHKIPDWETSNAKSEAKRSKLEQFVHDNDPAGPDSAEWHKGLRHVLEEHTEKVIAHCGKETEKTLKAWSTNGKLPKLEAVRTHLGVEISHDIRCDHEGDHMHKVRWNSKAVAILLFYIYELEHDPIKRITEGTNIVKNLTDVRDQLRAFRQPNKKLIEADLNFDLTVFASIIDNVLVELEVLKR